MKATGGGDEYDFMRMSVGQYTARCHTWLHRRDLITNTVSLAYKGRGYKGQPDIKNTIPSPNTQNQRVSPIIWEIGYE